MGEPARWPERVEEFVLGQIGDPPARVLEVGCGEGELARTLARAGHSVTAIDPRAPEGPIFRRVRIEEFSDPGPFDHVVAILSLHHVEDLGKVLDKIATLLRAGGTLIVVEFAWDRFDEATAEWALERLPAASSSEKPSWLQRCCWEWAHGDQGGTRAPAEARFPRWAHEEGFHSSRQMLGELGCRFVERLFAWAPYLYPDLGDDTSEADESAAIEAGIISATGFRYAGTVAPGPRGPLPDVTRRLDDRSCFMLSLVRNSRTAPQSRRRRRRRRPPTAPAWRSPPPGGRTLIPL